MEHRKISGEAEIALPKLNLTGLLGADQVFDPAGDEVRQAELIAANGSKIGNEALLNM